MMIKIEVDINIYKNSTKQVRVYSDTLPIHPDGTVDTWLWSEGHNRCDCSRGVLFARTRGEEENWYLPCTEGEYSVRIFHKGSLIYMEPYDE